MENYRVLLVDDEEEVIDVIMRKIDWNGLGFEIIGSAQNGMKALEMAEKYQPDIVITDIKMPYMDGLELSRHLKKDYPMIRIMLFTGFDEFQYAKEAISLDIEDYLMKPINSAELSAALTKLKNNLDQERDEKLNVQKLSDYYMESLPLLQVNFYVSLIEGRIREEEMARYIEDYRINQKGPIYTAVIIHTSEHQVPEGMSPMLLAMSVQQEAKRALQGKWDGFFFTYLGNTVMIANLSSEDDMAELTDDCEHFCRFADRMLGAVVTVGIGGKAEKLSELSHSYDGAREAVSYRVLYGTKRSININEIAPQEGKLYTQINDNALHDMFKVIQLGTEEAITEAVETVVADLHQQAKTVNQYSIATVEMVGSLYRYCNNIFIDFDDIKGSVKEPYKEVPQMDEESLKKWLLEIGLKLSENLREARSNSTRFIITKAKDMVKEQFANPDMSLDLVCSNLGVSNSYFSSIFKKETGKSFITYLTDYRMEKAAQLIIETTEKNYEIAEHVGYLDPNYFSYVFKKSYGMSPSKYRTENTQQ